jgi:hypothetical protein
VGGLVASNEHPAQRPTTSTQRRKVPPKNMLRSIIFTLARYHGVGKSICTVS